MPVSEPAQAWPVLNATRPASNSNAPGTARGGLAPDVLVFTGADPAARVVNARSIRELVFPCLWLFISFVSAFDTYLTVRFQEDLRFHEENPIGRLLLKAHAWDPSLLISAKCLGTTLVLGTLTALYLHNRRIGFTVTTALAIFQLGLLGYLLLV